MIHSRIRKGHNRNGKPRASGDDPFREAMEKGEITVNPARAGMIRALSTPTRRSSGKPRASGDDPGRLGRPHDRRP